MYHKMRCIKSVLSYLLVTDRWLLPSTLLTLVKSLVAFGFVKRFKSLAAGSGLIGKPNNWAKLPSVTIRLPALMVTSKRLRD